MPTILLPRPALVLAAGLVLLPVGPARAGAPEPCPAEDAKDAVRSVGAPSADPEKGTVGLVCPVAAGEPGEDAPSGQLAAIGPETGEAERDTFGYPLRR